MLFFIDFLEERECVEMLGRMKNRLHISLSPYKQCKETPPWFSQDNKGFINYIFCINKAVRNPAGTRLDSLAW